MQNTTTLGLDPAQFGPLFSTVFIMGMILMQIMFGVCIWRDANQRLIGGRPLILLTPFVWALAALLSGLLGVAFYWVCHYSRFYKIEK
jgi:hypothetical protein